jgi:hypothetical protein
MIKMKMKEIFIAVIIITVIVIVKELLFNKGKILTNNSGKKKSNKEMSTLIRKTMQIEQDFFKHNNRLFKTGEEISFKTKYDKRITGVFIGKKIIDGREKIFILTKRINDKKGEYGDVASIDRKNIMLDTLE